MPIRITNEKVLTFLCSALFILFSIQSTSSQSAPNTPDAPVLLRGGLNPVIRLTGDAANSFVTIRSVKNNNPQKIDWSNAPSSSLLSDITASDNTPFYTAAQFNPSSPTPISLELDDLASCKYYNTPTTGDEFIIDKKDTANNCTDDNGANPTPPDNNGDVLLYDGDFVFNQECIGAPNDNPDDAYCENEFFKSEGLSRESGSGPDIEDREFTIGTTAYSLDLLITSAHTLRAEKEGFLYSAITPDLDPTKAGLTFNLISDDGQRFPLYSDSYQSLGKSYKSGFSAWTYGTPHIFNSRFQELFNTGKFKVRIFDRTTLKSRIYIVRLNADYALTSVPADTGLLDINGSLATISPTLASPVHIKTGEYLFIKGGSEAITEISGYKISIDITPITSLEDGAIYQFSYADGTDQSSPNFGAALEYTAGVAPSLPMAPTLDVAPIMFGYDFDNDSNTPPFPYINLAQRQNSTPILSINNREPGVEYSFGIIPNIYTECDRFISYTDSVASANDPSLINGRYRICIKASNVTGTVYTNYDFGVDQNIPSIEIMQVNPDTTNPFLVTPANQAAFEVKTFIFEFGSSISRVVYRLEKTNAPAHAEEIESTVSEVGYINIGHFDLSNTPEGSYRLSAIAYDASNNPSETFTAATPVVRPDITPTAASVSTFNVQGEGGTTLVDADFTKKQIIGISGTFEKTSSEMASNSDTSVASIDVTIDYPTTDGSENQRVITINKPSTGWSFTGQGENVVYTFDTSVALNEDGFIANDGEYILKAYTRNTNGDLGPPNVFSTKLDTTAPTADEISLQPTTGEVTGLNKAAFEVSISGVEDADSGLQSVYFRIFKGQETLAENVAQPSHTIGEYTKTFDLSGAPIGEYTLQAKLVDNLENVRYIDSVNSIVRRAPQKLDVTYSDTSTDDTTPTITLVGAEAGAALTITASKEGQQITTEDCTADSDPTSTDICTFETHLPHGEISIVAIQTDSIVGDSPESDALILVINSQYPTLVSLARDEDHQVTFTSSEKMEAVANTNVANGGGFTFTITDSENVTTTLQPNAITVTSNSVILSFDNAGTALPDSFSYSYEKPTTPIIKDIYGNALQNIASTEHTGYTLDFNEDGSFEVVADGLFLILYKSGASEASLGSFTGGIDKEIIKGNINIGITSSGGPLDFNEDGSFEVVADGLFLILYKSGASEASLGSFTGGIDKEIIKGNINKYIPK